MFIKIINKHENTLKIHSAVNRTGRGTIVKRQTAPSGDGSWQTVHFNKRYKYNISDFTYNKANYLMGPNIY